MKEGGFLERKDEREGTIDAAPSTMVGGRVLEELDLHAKLLPRQLCTRLPWQQDAFGQHSSS